jgi:hypothetical protein
LRRKIKFEYWQNPFDTDKPEWVDESEADVVDKAAAWEPEPVKANPTRPVIPTAMGPIPITPYFNFGRAFEFWMGHTNFPIMDDVAEVLDEVPGIEMLDIITRYRFRFSVGHLFTGAEVKASIQEALNAVPPRKGEINPSDMRLPKEVRDKLDVLEKQARANFEMWSIYILPNGEIDFSSSDNQEQFDKQMALYKGAQEQAGGVIITSDSK